MSLEGEIGEIDLIEKLVTLGRESGDAVEVLSGLKAGQPIAVEGGFFLKTELLRDQLAGE